MNPPSSKHTCVAPVLHYKPASTSSDPAKDQNQLNKINGTKQIGKKYSPRLINYLRHQISVAVAAAATVAAVVVVALAVLLLFLVLLFLVVAGLVAVLAGDLVLDLLHDAFLVLPAVLLVVLPLLLLVVLLGLLVVLLLLILVVAPHVELLLDLVDDARHGDCSSRSLSLLTQKGDGNNGLCYASVVLVGSSAPAGIYRRNGRPIG
uniref:Uncharacterized protein n=1 Tax=Zea mays TaxID=4577 RepID=A0A804M1R4_MAIZE